MSNIEPLKKAIEYYSEDLKDIYEEVCGDSDTFFSAKQDYTEYIKSSPNFFLIKLLGGATHAQIPPGILLLHEFRKFLDAGARCHPDSLLHKLKRQTANIEAIDNPYTRYMRWREFIDEYIDTVEDVSFHASIAKNLTSISEDLQRKIISAGRRSQFYAHEIENAQKYYIERIKKKSNPLSVILAAQLSAVYQLNSYVLNAVNSMPLLHLVRTTSPFNDNKIYLRLLTLEWVKFNNPFNWLKQVYEITNQRNIGVIILVEEDTLHIEPINPALIRHIIDRIILLTFNLQTSKPNELFFSWDPHSSELRISFKQADKLSQHPQWKEVETLIGKLRTQWGIKRGDKNVLPFIFIKIPLIEEPPTPQLGNRNIQLINNNGNNILGALKMPPIIHPLILPTPFNNSLPLMPI